MASQVPISVLNGTSPHLVQKISKSYLQKLANLLYNTGNELADILGLKSDEIPRRIAEMIVLEWKITHCWPEETELENDLYEVVTIERIHQIAPEVLVLPG